MSNCKKVTITGRLPFYVSDNLEDKNRILNFIGQCAIPSFGIKVEFDQKEILIENQKGGGKTAVYPFRIYGIEALPFGYVHDLHMVFRRTCNRFGNYEIEVIDIENNNEVLMRDKSNIMPNASLA